LPDSVPESWEWPPRYRDEYLPSNSDPYWYRVRETMDPELRDALVLQRIGDVMRYAWTHSPFYRTKWENAGIHPNDVRSLDDFQNVPPVTKLELREDQEAHPPFGSYLCVESRDVRHIHGTSGTTGRPTAFGVSENDWRSIANAHARVMWSMGIRPSDSIFIASFFSLYMGSWGALIGGQRLGATVFPFGAGAPGQTRRAAQWMAEIRPTVLYATPSYAVHLAETASEMGIEPQEFGLRRIFFSGEPGGSIPAMRRRLSDIYGAQLFDSGSMAEVSPWMNLAETESHEGMLCWQDIVYTEVTSPTTYRQVPYGSEGTLIYTTLERTSQPMIRLLSNDLTRWESPSSACGRTYPILPHGVYGRVDDMFTVRGENVYPSAIADVILGLPHYGGEHRIIVSREESMDELVVQVEIDNELNTAGSSAIDDWVQLAEGALAATLGVRTRVVQVGNGTFERTQMKAARVVDSRDLFRSLASSDEL
jgi:phenylacetate-CoA ligase